MRALLFVFILTCAVAAFNTPPKLRRTCETWSIMDDHRRQYNTVKDELKRLTETYEHQWGFEQRFMDLIKDKERLKKEQFKLLRDLTELE